MNAEQATKRVMWEPTWRENREGRRLRETESEAPEGPTVVLATACMKQEKTGNTGNPSGTEVRVGNWHSVRSRLGRLGRRMGQ